MTGRSGGGAGPALRPGARSASNAGPAAGGPASVPRPGAEPASRASVPGASSFPASFLEVRVAPGRVAVNEFYSNGQARRLSEVLRAFGLETEEEFESPCG